MHLLLDPKLGAYYLRASFPMFVLLWNGFCDHYRFLHVFLFAFWLDKDVFFSYCLIRYNWLNWLKFDSICQLTLNLCDNSGWKERINNVVWKNIINTVSNFEDVCGEICSQSTISVFTDELSLKIVLAYMPLGFFLYLWSPVYYQDIYPGWYIPGFPEI